MQFEVNQTINYKWWRDDKGDIDPDHEGLLKGHADGKIAEDMAAGMTSGQLLIGIAGQNYQGWWESTESEVIPNTN